MTLKLQAIVEMTDGILLGNGPDTITGGAPFESAGPDEITYAGEAKFLKRLADTEAGAIFVPKAVETYAGCQVVVANPQVAFVQVLNHFHPRQRPEAQIDPRAVVGTDVQIGKNVYIGPCAVIGKGVQIGKDVVIHPNVVVGDNACIGDGSLIYPNVTIGAGTQIGARVIIHAGAAIGSDGFGFAPDGQRYHKIPHSGIVRIDDDVEVGANTTIDRATFGRTWIKRGVKIDNLVHVGHNVVVGEDSVLVAHVGIAGSAAIGHHAVIAGQVGIAPHTELGNHVTIGPQAGVASRVSDGEVLSGSPAIPHRQWLRVQRIVSRLPELKRKLTDLERQMGRTKANLDTDSNLNADSDD